MDRKIIVSIVAIVVVAISLSILLPGGRTVDPNPKLPWLIERNAAGETSVFGLTLGRSTLLDAEQSFNSSAQLNLFKSPEGHYDVEAYFDRLYISGLKASIVIKLIVDQTQAEPIFERGLRISQMGSGVKKVELSDQDKSWLANARIDILTYLPAADLEPALIEKHFGKPQQQLTEDSDTVHWLYPEKGLDIAVNSDGKEVFQYLSPSQFQRAIEPLQQR